MTSSKRGFPVLWWALWSVAAWLALAASVFSLVKDLENSTWLWCLVLSMPPLAVCCGWRAVRAGALLGRWARLIFWMVSLPGAALVVVLLQGQAEEIHQPYNRHLLVLAIAAAALALVFAIWREARTGNLKRAGFGWLVEILACAACLAAMVVSAYFVWLKAYIEPLRQKAEARWAEIGHPMPEFANTIRPVEENESLRELTRDLRPFGVATFYKTGSAGGRITALNNVNVPGEIINVLDNCKDQGDVVQVPDKAAAELDANRINFDRLYSGILHREPPVWEMDISSGFYYFTLVPNFLTTRQLAQWIVADAYHRLERGDEKGAAEAVAAEMRMIHNQGEQPILVSAMIHTAVESLFTPIVARLPADPDAMRQLASDVKTERRQFETTLQAEVWALMHTFEKTQPQMDDMRGFLAPAQPLPKWLERLLLPLYCRTVWRMEASKAWLIQADFIAICDRSADKPDLGWQEMVEAQDRVISIFTPNMWRCWLRLNSNLLLREQAEMIRTARAQMEAGKSGKLGEYDSVVIPGSKWTLTGDAGKNTITTRLSPVPGWVTGHEVAGDDYWLMPLDGSKGWQLRPPAAKVSAAAGQAADAQSF